ncbi:NAD(P)-dependent oxidoreductase [Terracidiphilus gabretensis]|uniref:NAD(P)-dependent oxidoreductase n=1 Tax=Terracidiphilus gabretensis TaxID=1577687 RepID=UPI00071B06AF|nr:NAD(P)-dependent oxidoreductase [Terracidiphilus gabretensis]
METDLALSEQLPPLTVHEATVEADRCLYCYDAPCTHACPTHIDIPKFIKKIATRNLRGSAQTIYAANLLGATCARVCPVQELCEGACVLGSEHKPIAIGRLQRYAMDSAKASGVTPRARGVAAGIARKIAVVGAGPAGLSCAGELALRGHDVTVFEKRELPGGLSTYGIIALREPVDVAIDEARMIEGLGVKIRTGVEFGRDVTLERARGEFDTIVLSVGLGATPALGIEGEEAIVDGLAYIEMSKTDAASLRVGRNVVVIGAGNTAIDCATIAKRLRADRVTMVYRRTVSEMTCYEHEYLFALSEGIEFRFLAQPVGVVMKDGEVAGLECLRVELGKPDATGRPAPVVVAESEFVIEADQIVKAVGQVKPNQEKTGLAAAMGLKTEKGYIAVSADFETSVAGVYAIGDCVRARGAASTVMAVQDGKVAARAIEAKLSAVAAEVK